MDNDEKKNAPKATYPLPPDGTDANGKPTWQGESHPPPATSRSDELAALVGKSPPATPAAPIETYEIGQCAFLTTSLSKGDGTTTRAMTYVRVLSVEHGRYRLSLGRGLTTLSGPEHMQRMPAGGIDGKLAFDVGDVVELRDAPKGAPT